MDPLQINKCYQKAQAFMRQKIRSFTKIVNLKGCYKVPDFCLYSSPTKFMLIILCCIQSVEYIQLYLGMFKNVHLNFWEASIA